MDDMDMTVKVFSPWGINGRGLDDPTPEQRRADGVLADLLVPVVDHLTSVLDAAAYRGWTQAVCGIALGAGGGAKPSNVKHRVRLWASIHGRVTRPIWETSDNHRLPTSLIRPVIELRADQWKVSHTRWSALEMRFGYTDSQQVARVTSTEASMALMYGPATIQMALLEPL